MPKDYKGNKYAFDSFYSCDYCGGMLVTDMAIWRGSCADCYYAPSDSEFATEMGEY